MADTGRKRLGASALTALTATTVYAVTSLMDAKVNVTITNISSRVPVDVDIAICNGAISTLADEDYIFKNRQVKLGETIVIEDKYMTSLDTVYAYAGAAGVTVSVDGIEQNTAGSGGAVVKKIAQTDILYTDFTFTSGVVSGYVDLDTSLPAGAVPLGWKATVVTGFSGDTTSVAYMGVSGDTDRFSADTTGSVLTAGAIIGAVPIAATACDEIAAAKPIRLTVIGGAGFQNIASGDMDIEFYYIDTV